MNFAPDTFAGLAGPESDLFYKLLPEVAGEGVEIGCLDGYGAAHILDAAPKLHLTSIDPFVPDSMEASLLGSEVKCRYNLAPFEGRWSLVKDYCEKVVRTWHTPLDFLFVDGDHRYEAVLRDFNEWSTWVKPGGILAMHDSRMSRPGGANFHPGPSQVAADCIYACPERWEIIGEAFSLTVARKRA